MADAGVARRIDRIDAGPRFAPADAIRLNQMFRAADTPALLAAAKEDHRRRLAQTPYVCPIPAEVEPPLQPRPQAA